MQILKTAITKTRETIASNPINRHRVMKERMKEAQERIASGKSRITHKHIHGVPVYVYDDMVVATGNKYAVAVRDFWMGDIICIEESIEYLPSQVIKFIVFHEEAHVVLKHIGRDLYDTMNRMEIARSGEVITQELEADDYAARHMGYGEAIKALRCLTQNIASNKYGNKATIMGLESRIAVLEKTARESGNK